VPGNRCLAQALLRQRPNLRGIIGFGTWSVMSLPAFAQFISIYRWLQLIYTDWLAPLATVPFSTPWG